MVAYATCIFTPLYQIDSSHQLLVIRIHAHKLRDYHTCYIIFLIMDLGWDGIDHITKIDPAEELPPDLEFSNERI